MYSNDDLQPSNFRDIEKVSNIIAPLFKSTGSQQFPTLLSVALESIVEYDSLLITRFAPQPVVEHIQYPLKTYSDDMLDYTDAVYLLDPFYRAAVDQGLRGFRALNDLAPQGFQDSEYYRRYYGKTGLGDECGFIINCGPDAFINIGINRFVNHSPFLKHETQLFAAISPLIETVCEIHWDLMATQDTGGSQLNRQLELALENFGTSQLTPRECEIIHLLLRGHSSQSMAARLGISVETIKIHRRNSYVKLDISSQSELFHLFIIALQSFDVYRGGDPLSGFC